MCKDESPIFNCAPSAENAVYFLLGLLWEYVPYKFIFEEFEVDPKRRGYEFNKYVDACGKEWKGGEWIDVNFEFKLRSSGLLNDIKKYPDFKPDWLICWEHDAEAAEFYSGKILCLFEIFTSLPDEKKKNILINPHMRIKDWNKESNMKDLLSRFSNNRSKVHYILKKWQEYIPGNSEILLLKKGRTVARICSYSSEYLLLQGNQKLMEHIKENYSTIISGDSIRVLLKNIDKIDIQEILNKIETYSF